MHWKLVKCLQCKKEISFQSKYMCCGKLADVCHRCSLGQCSKCKASSRISSEYDQKLDYGLSKRCSRCLKLISSSDEPFSEVKCQKLYCFSCIDDYYQKYRQTMDKFKKMEGIVPEIRVDLPCECEYDQQEIVTFLRKYCWYCNKMIESPFEAYQLTNNMRIMKTCYQRIKSRGQMNFAEYKPLLTLLSKLTTVCSCCGQMMTSIGSKVDDIYLCQLCYKQTALTESHFEQLKKEEPPLKKQKRNCQKCATVLTQSNSDRLSTFCRNCLEKGLFDKETMNKRAVKQSIIDLDEQSLERTQNKLKKGVLEEENDGFESEIISKDLLGLNISQKIKGMAAPKQLLSKGQIKDVQEELEQYCLKISQQKEPRLFKCSQCLLLINPQELLFTFERKQNQLSSTRVAESEVELQKYQKTGKIKRYCKICYFLLKIKLQDQEDMKSPFDNRIYRVSPKREQVSSTSVKKEQFYKDSKYSFSGKKQSQKQEPILYAPLLESKTANTAPEIVYTKCQECRNYFYTSKAEHATDYVCSSCKTKQQIPSKVQESEKKKKQQKSKQIRCKLCRFPKDSKQMNSKMKEYCIDCSKKIRTNI